MNESLGLPFQSPDARPFWEGAAQKRLRLQRCTGCGRARFPAAWLCPHCHASGGEWFDARPQGRVHSWTIVRRAANPAWRERVPYVLAIVDMADGVRMMGNVLGADALEVAIGDPVEVCFEERGALRVPQFRKVAA